MTDYEKIYDFQNLYKAHTKARLGKREKREVIDFELNLAQKISTISDEYMGSLLAVRGGREGQKLCREAVRNEPRLGLLIKPVCLNCRI